MVFTVLYTCVHTSTYMVYTVLHTCAHKHIIVQENVTFLLALLLGRMWCTHQLLWIAMSGQQLANLSYFTALDVQTPWIDKEI